ncbi:MAG: hypothetical protein R3F49_15015 [Planctomycetota bacterium]
MKHRSHAWLLSGPVLAVALAPNGATCPSAPAPPVVAAASLLQESTPRPADSPAEGRAARAAGELDEHLVAWPDLADEPAAKREVARVRKATSDEMAADAGAQIAALGAAAAPLLLDALGKERDPEARARITGALDSITAAPHTRLLAREWAHASEFVRAYTLDRVAAFPDAGLLETARAHYLALVARAADPKARRPPSDGELDSAARAAASTGALEGLPRCLEQAERDWKRLAPTLRAACSGAKGEAGAELLIGKLTGAGTDAARVAALNLLASVGTKSSVSVIRRFLDSNANNVRVATINALRGIVDGEPPIENLSVFTAIEEAKRWKDRT